MSNYTKKSTKKSEIEVITSKKIKSLKLAESYKRQENERKFKNVYYCGTCLEFKKFKDETRKLHSANFCGTRLCPQCTKRLSMKRFCNLSQVVTVLKKEHRYSLLFLTLTVKNIAGEELRATIQHMLKSFRHMSRTVQFAKSINGWFRAVEVTYNKKTEEYHPHIHVVLAVRYNYFKRVDDLFITKDMWIAMWRKALQVNYDPSIAILADGKKNEAGLMLEVTKYTTKDSDYLDDKLLQNVMDKVVEVLDKALRQIKLVGYGGKLLKIYKKLRLEDKIEKNIITEISDKKLGYIIERYRWNIGFKKYELEETYEDIGNDVVEVTNIDTGEVKRLQNKLSSKKNLAKIKEKENDTS